jgi:hypothetical protein
VGHSWWQLLGHIGSASWPGLMNNAMFLFKPKFHTTLNLNQPIGDLPKLEKFQIKYGFEGFDERNNFPYRKFPRFVMDCELKFKEAYRV